MKSAGKTWDRFGPRMTRRGANRGAESLRSSLASIGAIRGQRFQLWLLADAGFFLKSLL